MSISDFLDYNGDPIKLDQMYYDTKTDTEHIRIVLDNGVYYAHADLWNDKELSKCSSDLIPEYTVDPQFT